MFDQGEPRPYDRLLMVIAFGLTGLGMIAIYSTTAMYPYLGRYRHTTEYTFISKTVLHAIIGVSVMILAAKVHYRVYQRYARWLLVVTFGLLVLLVFGGTTVNNATRWFSVGGVRFQPIELAKFTWVAYMAFWLSTKADKARSFGGFLVVMLLDGLLVVFAVLQPDYGSALLLLAVSAGLLYVAGGRLKHMAATIGFAALVALPLFFPRFVSTGEAPGPGAPAEGGAAPQTRRDVHMSRIDAWKLNLVDMDRFIQEADAKTSNATTNLYQLLVTVAGGGAFGRGMGYGVQKLGYLPEAHTDFILAVIVEELGFVMIPIVLAAYLLILWRGVRIGLRAEDEFGRYLAIGLTLMITVQAMVNVAVVLGALPTKGFTLPFISYGGSSLVVSFFMIGVLLNVSMAEPEPAWLRAGLARTLAGYLSTLSPRARRVK